MTAAQYGLVSTFKRKDSALMVSESKQAVRRPFDRTIALVFLGFVMLGMPEALLGIAWPSIQDDFGLPAPSIGAFLLAGTGGFTLSSFISGRVIQRFGIRRVLVTAYIIIGLAALSVRIAPSWEFIVALGFCSGFGGGFIDTGVNVYVASYNNPRLMNWLHGFFGLGATISPLIMTAIIDSGVAWRWGYAIVGGLSLIVGLIFALSPWRRVAIPEDDDTPKETVPLSTTLRLPLAWLGIMTFVLYAGLEVSAGQWSFSLFTEGRAIAPGTAGIWVSLYWGTFTLGRFLFGFISDRFDIDRQILLAMIFAGVGSALVWLNPSPAVSFAGLALIGFALAPIFPLLIATTEARVGPRDAPNLIGFQVAAASIGVGLMPWLAGVLVQAGTNPLPSLFTTTLPIDVDQLRYNPALEVIGPYLVAVSGLMLAFFLLTWLTTRRR